MPELPDVETFKRYVDRTALHKKIRAVTVSNAQSLKGISRKRFADRLRGRTMVKSKRHGKYLGVKLDSGDWLVLHFGMTGNLEYYKDGKPPRFTRFRFDFTNGYHLAYVSMRQLGRNRIVDDFSGFVTQNNLGVDALDRALTPSRFRDLIEGRRGTLKAFLMNQSIVAGIGNEYADEILFHAKLDPERKAEQLTKEEVKRLYNTMRRVLRAAVDRGADPSKYPKSWLLPRRQKGGACPRCGKALRTKKVTGRTTYWCPRCQRK